VVGKVEAEQMVLFHDLWWRKPLHCFWLLVVAF
jgi:hypothetical protein